MQLTGFLEGGVVPAKYRDDIATGATAPYRIYNITEHISGTRGRTYTIEVVPPPASTLATRSQEVFIEDFPGDHPSPRYGDYVDDG